eukprot:TRINITY_DN35_c0_g2_i4.p2 TRINITY_DN35_c0_g2~~TRINITY_DN35_c0_g2_i4.p2  ORF type:complete len:124 (-),score=34.55 TRINITY_DN35_c0_g2_i4:151-522(-)
MIVVDHESASFRRMMMQIDPKNAPTLPKQQVQVNTRHPIIVNIYRLHKVNPSLAKDVLEQVFDNALVQAGLFDDSRLMVPRINKLLEMVLSKESGDVPLPESSSPPDPFVATSQESEFKEVKE